MSLLLLFNGRGLNANTLTLSVTVVDVISVKRAIAKAISTTTASACSKVLSSLKIFLPIVTNIPATIKSTAHTISTSTSSVVSKILSCAKTLTKSVTDTASQTSSKVKGILLSLTTTLSVSRIASTLKGLTCPTIETVVLMIIGGMAKVPLIIITKQFYADYIKKSRA